ncbi:MAG: HlyU family transcriptional regulator [Pseudomonadota bacterium]
MAFFKKLFGIADKGEEEPVKTTATTFEGFEITPTPIKEGDQFRVSGVIAKTVSGERKEHTFIRADLYAGKEAAVEATIAKAKRIIKEQGDLMFS